MPTDVGLGLAFDVGLAFVLGFVTAIVLHIVVVVPADDVVTAECILSFIFLCSSKFLWLEFDDAKLRLGVLSGLVNINCVGGVAASTEVDPWLYPSLGVLQNAGPKFSIKILFGRVLPHSS